MQTQQIPPRYLFVFLSNNVSHCRPLNAAQPPRLSLLSRKEKEIGTFSDAGEASQPLPERQKNEQTDGVCFSLLALWSHIQTGYNTE